MLAAVLACECLKQLKLVDLQQLELEILLEASGLGKNHPQHARRVGGVDMRGAGVVEMNSYRNRENYRLFSHGKLRSVLVALGAFCAFCILAATPIFAQSGAVLGVVSDTSG